MLNRHLCRCALLTRTRVVVEPTAEPAALNPLRPDPSGFLLGPRPRDVFRAALFACRSGDKRFVCAIHADPLLNESLSPPLFARRPPTLVLGARSESFLFFFVRMAKEAILHWRVLTRTPNTQPRELALPIVASIGGVVNNPSDHLVRLAERSLLRFLRTALAVEAKTQSFLGVVVGLRHCPTSSSQSSSPTSRGSRRSGAGGGGAAFAIRSRYHAATRRQCL